MLRSELSRMRMRWENRTGEYWHSAYEGAKHTLNTYGASNLFLGRCSANVRPWARLRPPPTRAGGRPAAGAGNTPAMQLRPGLHGLQHAQIISPFRASSFAIP